MKLLKTVALFRLLLVGMAFSQNLYSSYHFVEEVPVLSPSGKFYAVTPPALLNENHTATYSLQITDQFHRELAKIHLPMGSNILGWMPKGDIVILEASPNLPPFKQYLAFKVNSSPLLQNQNGSRPTEIIPIGITLDIVDRANVLNRVTPEYQ